MTPRWDAFRSALDSITDDTGQRYVSTALCGEVKSVAVPARAHPMDPRTAAPLDRYRQRWEIIV